MQPHTKNRALQIAFPSQQMMLRPSFSSRPRDPFAPAACAPVPFSLATRYGKAAKPFLVSPGMEIADRSTARPKHRRTAHSAAEIRQREIAAKVIAIDLRRPVQASGARFKRRDQQQTEFMGSFNALRPVARLGHQIIGWLRPSH